MRHLATISGILLMRLSVAQSTFAGTKPDLTVGTSGQVQQSGGGSFLQMMFALGVVFLLLKFVLPKVANKLNKRLVTTVNGGILIEESAQFAGGSLYVVNARGKALLLSVSSSGVSCIADLTKPSTEQPLFDEILGHHAQQPAQCAAQFLEPVFEGEPDPQTVLSRIQRLGV